MYVCTRIHELTPSPVRNTLPLHTRPSPPSEHKQAKLVLLHMYGHTYDYSDAPTHPHHPLLTAPA